MSVLAEAPARSAASAISSPAVPAHTAQIAPYPLSTTECVAVRGVLPPRSVALPSALAAQSALLASLAAPPPHLLEVRRRTDAFRPILAKEHSCVYVDRRKRHDHGYVLRPNFRQLNESDDPESHPSLHVVKSLPPSVQRSATGKIAPSSSREDGSARNANATGGLGGADCLYMVRAPRRGVAIETARLAREARDRADDFEAAGLRPRPIKSVAEILAAQHLSAAAAGVGAVPGASPMKKPTHLRLTSLNPPAGSAPFSLGDSGMVAMASTSSAALSAAASADRSKLTLNVGGPTGAAHSSSMARFAAALKLPSYGSGASASRMPPTIQTTSVAFSGLPATADSDDEAEEVARRQERMGSAFGGGGFGGFPAPASSASAAPASPRPSAPSTARPGAAEAVVVAGAAGSSCCICTTTDFVEPWISECAHICCSECWATWLNENPEKQCPECDAAISLEELRPIALCPICSAIPTQPWSAPCRHMCCRGCWKIWLNENPVCPECNEPVDKNQLPPG